jgi:ribosome biogenesis GTPase A
MLAMDTIHAIQDLYPGRLEEIYKAGEVNPNGMLKAIALKRHFRKEEDALDLKRAAQAFLFDLRHGKLGRLTLEGVPHEKNQ